MTDKSTTLGTWPKSDSNEPIFNNTGDAFLYAALIYDLPEIQGYLFSLRVAYKKATTALLDAAEPDFDLASVCACKCQFFRECLEECKRIQEKSKLQL